MLNFRENDRYQKLVITPLLLFFINFNNTNLEIFQKYTFSDCNTLFHSLHQRLIANKLNQTFHQTTNTVQYIMEYN